MESKELETEQEPLSQESPPGPYSSVDTKEPLEPLLTATEAEEGGPQGNSGSPELEPGEEEDESKIGDSSSQPQPMAKTSDFYYVKGSVPKRFDHPGE